jgi:hypothetical protein
MQDTCTARSCIRFGLLFLTLLAYSISSHASELDIGKQWYERRAEEANGLETDSRAIDRAIYFLHKALEHRATEEEAGILLLKSYYFKGEFTTQGEEQKRLVFAGAKDLGERLLQKYPTSPGLRLFYSANLGKWGEYSGVLAAAESGIADKIRVNAEKILEIDPKYGQGAGYYLLGAIHFRAPYIPFLLSWPDNREAIVNLRKAHGMAPESLGIKLILAQALLRQGDQKVALSLLQEVSRQAPRRFRLLEDRAYIEEARGLLKEHRPEQTATNESH